MTTQAQYGQNNVPDPNTQTGWTVQGGGQVPNSSGTTSLGVPGVGYAQTGNAASNAALNTSGNGTPGVPNPIPGNVTEILTNPGYADASPSLVIPGTTLASALVPVPASGTAFKNPSGLSCQVVITGGTVTAVKVGTVTVGAGDGTYTIPAGSSISDLLGCPDLDLGDLVDMPTISDDEPGEITRHPAVSDLQFGNSKGERLLFGDTEDEPILFGNAAGEHLYDE